MLGTPGSSAESVKGASNVLENVRRITGAGAWDIGAVKRITRLINLPLTKLMTAGLGGSITSAATHRATLYSLPARPLSPTCNARRST